MKNMEYFMVPAEKVSLQQFRKSEKEVIGGLCSLANIPLTPESARDQERRIRREIANSNERRRMQSINSGFQSLKTLIPHSDGEKLSKAAILQQTAEYIIALEQEKTQLLQQNNQLKRFIQQEFTGSSPKRRRTEEKDEGIGSPDILEEEKLEDLRRELLELRQHLEKERSARAQLEEQLRSLDTQLYPEKLKAVAQQVQEQHSLLHTQTLLRLQQLQQQQQQQQQQQPERDSASRSPQVMPPPTPPAPTHHPTVIVPAPTHFATAAVSPNPSSNIMSTSRQNLDTIVQAIQHIEGTQRVGGVEEEQRRAVIVTPRRVSMETTGSDTASDSEGEGNFAMT
ncbi:transcription factor AP-4 isoform X3 [Clupea harengus]|uniref:Transcription factor AP-4 isoform X3 n=1 Tax=Clupea harengus TaxID=7950 RepID=A0A6P8F6V3_CLUHA|nr:transcription factor AP-4 isoform X3 [Clupea harengus]